MDEKIALHTAARRFLMAQASLWFDRYEQLERTGKSRVRGDRTAAWDDTDAAYALFPRYRLDGAILTEVERLVPTSYHTVAELRNALSKVAEQGLVGLVREFEQNPRAMSAFRAELRTFSNYVTRLPARELRHVEVLPYRRVLSPDESKCLWKLLAEQWGITPGDYWFPLTDGTPPSNAIAFHQDLWEARDGPLLLLTVLAERNVHRCFVLRSEIPPDYEIETSSVSAYYDGGEMFITSNAEWLLYSSHERSITVAGWLGNWFRQQWPDADNVTYRGPFHTDDLRGTWEP